MNKQLHFPWPSFGSWYYKRLSLGDSAIATLDGLGLARYCCCYCIPVFIF
jgi:DNA-directed RNA polymerase subunit N (RpoN/RPB10)